jgi:hypothetical protein
MTSIAQAVPDKMDGVQSAPKTKREPRPVPVMTEEVRSYRASLKNALKVGVWIVEFTKVDGTSSVMECTLDPRIIPSDPTIIHEAPNKERQESEHLVHVYATDRQGWRSFYAANVQRSYQMPEPL